MNCVLSELFAKALVYQMNVSNFELSRKGEEASSSGEEVKVSSCESYRNFGKELLSNYL